MPRRDASGGSPSETTPLLVSRHTSTADQIVNSVTSQDLTGAALAPGHGILPSNGRPVPIPEHDVENQQPAPEAEAPISKPHEGLPEVKERMYIIFPALAVGVFLVGADQTIIVSSRERIGSELHALNLTSWIATAYFLTLTSFQPLYGKLSDIFGRKPCLIFCYSVFGLGCLACGMARDMTQLIVARAVAGIGAGGTNVVVTVLMSDIMTLRERGKWQGYLNLIWSAGSSVGAPLGGLVADRLGWRWAFLVQGPLCFVAIMAVVLALHLPKKPDQEMGWTKKLRRIDFLGALILVCAVFLLLLALDRGSNVSWKEPISYGSLIASAVLAVAFAVVETKVAKEPFAPKHIIFSRSTIANYLCNFFGMAGAVSSLFYAPLYYQAVGGLSATVAGLCLIPNTFSAVTGSLSTGFLMQKTGKYYRATIFDYGLLMIGSITMLNVAGLVVNSVPGTIVGGCLQSFGNTGGLTATLIGAIANVAHEDQALAISCSYLFRSLGSVVGVSLSASIANQVLKAGLAVKLPQLGLSENDATEIAERVRGSLDDFYSLEPNIRAVVTACYSRSITAAFAFESGLVVCAFVSAWFVIEKPLSR